MTFEGQRMDEKASRAQYIYGMPHIVYSKVSI